ncbi:hypothetical protein ACQEVF_32350 [Nonomuraea polychroma]|uniref:hypothetical protein n=1 Tax=Nonomuraea polychroma TaxID=46176 RepID=UPI003D8BAA63
MSVSASATPRRSLKPSLGEVLLALAGALATTTLVAAAAAAATLRTEDNRRTTP